MQDKSYLTAITRKTLSAPLKFLINSGRILIGHQILDYGCGKGADCCWLHIKGYKPQGFDPHWYNDPLALMKEYDVVLCTYVLNVVDSKTRTEVIACLKDLVVSDGKIYITVRRDFAKDYVTKKGTMQYVVYLPYKIV